MGPLALPSIIEQIMSQLNDSEPAAWTGWVASGVALVFSVLWAFFGRRAVRWLSIAQGALTGFALGGWIGLAIEGAREAGGMKMTIWLGVPAQLHLSTWGILGALVGALLFGLLGRVLIRVVFFISGGLAGGLLLMGVRQWLRGTPDQPWVIVLIVFLLTGTGVLLLSLRYLAGFTGIWGGLCVALSLAWPMVKLFVYVGGPAWLPYLTAGGFGILAAIAGTALQLDKEAEQQNLKTYQ